jgi:hypothetical protein
VLLGLRDQGFDRAPQLSGHRLQCRIVEHQLWLIHQAPGFTPAPACGLHGTMKHCIAMLHACILSQECNNARMQGCNEQTNHGNTQYQ